MVNQEIFNGLKTALAKGYSLKHAMMSFYNAGYKKEEIEGAARAIQIERLGQQTSPGAQARVVRSTKPTQAKTTAPKTIFSKTTKPDPNLKKEVKQVVSNYEQEQGKKSNTSFIILIVVLVILLAGLAGVFFFKTELVEFFNNLFG